MYGSERPRKPCSAPARALALPLVRGSEKPRKSLIVRAIRLTRILWCENNINSMRAMIHNASDWLPDRNALSAFDTMQRMMQIHVTAPYMINLAFADMLLNSTANADIIHITDYVVEKGSEKHIAYAASKAAMDNLTLSFAKFFALL